MPAKTMSSLISRAESKVLLLLDTFFDKVKEVNVSKETTVILLEENLSIPPNITSHAVDKQLAISSMFKYMKWFEFLNIGSGQENDIAFTYQKDWPALIEYTGGTTGEPKGVLLSNDNVNAVANQYKKSGVDLARGQSWQTVSAPFIAYVLVFSTHLPLSYGMVCKIITYEPESIAVNTIKDKYNHIAANPFVWETIIHYPGAQNCDLSHLIAPTTGADYMGIKLEDEINTFFANHGCTWKICQAYGLTEVASGISINISNECNREGSVGIPFIFTCVSAFDMETGEELSYGNTGEICISGPSVMLGYLKNDDATRKVIKTHKDGTVWFHSGDLGHIDEDGFIFIDGRIKRMLVRYDGAKIFPPIIEKTIISLDAIKKCVVVGKQDSRNSVGQIPVAFIILEETFVGEEAAIEKSVIQVCAEHLPDYEHPQEYHFIKEFPMTAVGKVDYRALEKGLI